MATDPRIAVASTVTFELVQADRTKRWLSERSGIPYSTLDRKPRGHGDFTFTELFMIAEALGVEPWKLTPPAFVPTASVGAA